jgi:glutaredoxin
MITIFTTETCPKCRILKKKLEDKGLEYTEVTDEEKLRQMDILSVPVMTVDGERMDFAEAIKYVNER